MKRILVIDDEEMIIDVIQTILSDMGYEVVGCSVPEDGIVTASQSEFDIVFCDLRMPGKNGAEVTAAILAESPKTRIVIITAHPGDPLTAEAMKAGAESVLKKPFSVAKVIEYLEEKTLTDSVNAGSTHKVVVLVVDDDQAVLELVCTMIESFGMAVQRATTGREALARITESGPNLIVTDIVMPDMEGIELIRELGKRRPIIPIVVMSGHPVGEQFLRSACVLGARAALTKPFSAGELKMTIAKALEQPG